MASWTKGTYTLKGLALLAKLTQGNTLTITRVVTGTGYVDPALEVSQTAVTGERQVMERRTATYPESGMCKLPVFITNESVTSAYTARQIGFYAEDPDDGEILYMLAQASEGTFVPTGTQIPGFSANFEFYFRYGEADDVSFTVDPSNTASREDLEEVIAIAEAGPDNMVNGEQAVFDDAANLPFTALKVYGKSTQAGTPTPSAPVDVVSIGEDGTVEMRVYGKNLANAQRFAEITTDSNTSVTVSSDGYTIEAVGGSTVAYSSTVVTQPYKLLAGKTVVLKADSITNSLDSSGKGGNVQLYINTSGGNIYKAISSKNLKISVEIPADATAIRLGVYTNNSSTLFETDNTTTVKGLMLSLVDGDWEAYKPAQTVTISTPNALNGIPVTSGGNYTDAQGQQWICDELDLARGVYVRRVYSQELTFYYDETNDRYSSTTTHDMATGSAIDQGIPVLSDILPYNSAAGSGSPNANGIRGAASSPKYIIAYHNGDEITTATVLYPLATPVETPLTDEELEACKALHANNPNTTVLNDAGAEMLVGCIDSANESAFQMALRSASAAEDIEAHNVDTTAHADIRELVDEAVSAVSDAKATEKSLTIPASGWTGSAAPYINTISVTGVKAVGTNQDIYPADTIDADTLKAWQAANMIGAGQANGSITLKAFGTKPPVNLPAGIKITPVQEV